MKSVVIDVAKRATLKVLTRRRALARAHTSLHFGCLLYFISYSFYRTQATCRNKYLQIDLSRTMLTLDNDDVDTLRTSKRQRLSYRRDDVAF